MIKSLFVAYAATGVSHFIRASGWAFASIEVFHLIGLALFGGALVLEIAVRAGLAPATPSADAIVKGLGRIRWPALVLLLVSGGLLAGVNPLKYYYNDAFRVKAAFIFAGLAAFAGVRLLARARWPRWPVTSAAFRLALWLGAALSGRAIGLL